jgi:hypothetical protein
LRINLFDATIAVRPKHDARNPTFVYTAGRETLSRKNVTKNVTKSKWKKGLNRMVKPFLYGGEQKIFVNTRFLYKINRIHDLIDCKLFTRFYADK